MNDFFAPDTVLTEEMGSGLYRRLLTMQYEPANDPQGILSEQHTQHLSFSGLAADDAEREAISQRIASFVYEATLKMESEAMRKHPDVVCVSNGPEKAQEAARVFAQRILGGHPLYREYLGKRTALGSTYRLAIILVYALVPAVLKGKNRHLFIFSIATSAWTLKRSGVSALKDVVLFRVSPENAEFSAYIERYHTGSSELPKEE